MFVCCYDHEWRTWPFRVKVCLLCCAFLQVLKQWRWHTKSHMTGQQHCSGCWKNYLWPLPTSLWSMWCARVILDILYISLHGLLAFVRMQHGCPIKEMVAKSGFTVWFKFMTRSCVTATCPAQIPTCDCDCIANNISEVWALLYLYFSLYFKYDCLDCLCFYSSISKWIIRNIFTKGLILISHDFGL